MRWEPSGEEVGLEKCEGMDALPFGRLHKTRDDAVGPDAFFPSGSEAHFAEDDQLAQRLLRTHPGREEGGRDSSAQGQ